MELETYEELKHNITVAYKLEEQGKSSDVRLLC